MAAGNTFVMQACPFPRETHRFERRNNCPCFNPSQILKKAPIWDDWRIAILSDITYPDLHCGSTNTDRRRSSLLDELLNDYDNAATCWFLRCLRGFCWLEKGSVHTCALRMLLTRLSSPGLANAPAKDNLVISWTSLFPTDGKSVLNEFQLHFSCLNFPVNTIWSSTIVNQVSYLQTSGLYSVF